MEDLEKDIKKYFQKRQIKPSESAWEKMETLLIGQQPEQKKRKSYFYVLSAAASVLLFIGLWIIFEKVDHSIPEIEQPIETLVVNDEQVPMRDEVKETSENEQKEPVIKKQLVKQTISNLKNTSNTNTATAIVSNKESVVPKWDQPTEKSEVVPVYDIKEERLIAARSHVEIRVNREQLLRRAEVERQVENVTTDGQNFWKKIKEVNTVVLH